MGFQLFIHAGAPRTATTALQSFVFPRMRTIRYLGKDAKNSLMGGTFNPLFILEDAFARLRAGDSGGMEQIRRLLGSALTVLKLHNHKGDAVRGLELTRIFAACLSTAVAQSGSGPALFSDESLVESASGLVSQPEFGDGVPLEQLHAIGFLENASLSVVLRDPADFMRASYYKAMEFRRGKTIGLSFDEYVKQQLVIYERSPSASRIFLCTHRAATRHFSQLCKHAVVTSYSDLVASTHVLDTLLGFATGEEPISLTSLPKENNSWRDKDANAYIMGAPGVPAGLPTVQDYAQTFPETLEKYGFNRLIAADAQSR